MSWSLGNSVSFLLDGSLVAIGVIFMLFSGPLTRRHEARTEARIANGTLDPSDTKPAPEYLKLGAMAAGLGAFFTFLSIH